MTGIRDSVLPPAPLSGGPVLCMDIDGTSAPTGKNACFDVDLPPLGLRFFMVDDFPLSVHPRLPTWFDELSAIYTHCVWISDWREECVRFARGAGVARGVKWPYLEAPPNYLRHWHKLDAVTYWVDPDVPVAVVDDHMAPQNLSPMDEHILNAIQLFLERPGPTLLVAPAQEIGLTRPAVDLLCWFARHPNDPMFAVSGVHRLNPDMTMQWPDLLSPWQEQPVPCLWTKVTERE